MGAKDNSILLNIHILENISEILLNTGKLTVFMKVYCFGNEFLKEDSLAKEFADELLIDGVEFVKCSSPEEVFEEDNEKIVILDVVGGVDEVILIDNLSQLQTGNMVSLHDFDLAYFLKLMRRMGTLKEINIIGIPMEGDKDKIKEGITNIIQTKL